MQNRDCPTDRCTPDCEQVFEAVHVSYLMRGGTYVMWSINPNLEIPGPWTFQLQFSREPRQSGSWENVGLPVTNSFYAIDSDRRYYGQSIDAFYRLQMTAVGFSATSRIFSVDGVLSPRDWRIAQEILRKERLRAGYTAVDGYLLRRRNTGADCSRCVDIQTGEPMDPNCPNCLGTGKECGYYYPLSCVWADLNPATRDLKIDDGLSRGTVEDVQISARMLVMPPFLSAFDVWVDDRMDQRYSVGSIRHVAAIRSVPLIASVELQLLPYTDTTYQINIPQQTAKRLP